MQKHLEALPPIGDPDIQSLAKFGKVLGELVLSKETREALGAFSAEHLVVVHDASASRIPWETLHLGDSAPALMGPSPIRANLFSSTRESVAIPAWNDTGIAAR